MVKLDIVLYFTFIHFINVIRKHQTFKACISHIRLQSLHSRMHARLKIFPRDFDSVNDRTLSQNQNLACYIFREKLRNRVHPLLLPVFTFSMMSFMSISPLGRVLTTTTLSPAIWALAGFVPWALTGTWTSRVIHHTNFTGSVYIPKIPDKLKLIYTTPELEILAR